MRWIRLNIDFDDSPWLFNLSAEIQLAWIKLLCHVKRDGVKGRCRALMPMVAAKKWGVSQSVVEQLIAVAEQANALDVEDDVWVVLNWDKYQMVDPKGAERMARHRERKRSSEEDFESESEDVTRNNTVTCHATETKTSTKTKKEKQAKKDFLAETPVSCATPFGGSRQLAADDGGGVSVVGYGTERGTLTFVKRHLSIEGHDHATPLGVSLSLGETVGVGRDYNLCDIRKAIDTLRLDSAFGLDNPPPCREERGSSIFRSRYLSIEGNNHATPLGVSLSLGETVGVGRPLKSTGTFRLATLIFPCLWGNGKRELFRGVERGRRKLAVVLATQHGNCLVRRKVDFPHPSSDTSQPPPSPSELGEGTYPSILGPSSRFLAFGATNRKGSSPRRKGAWVPSPGWRDSLRYPPYGGAVSGTNLRGFDKTDFPSELGEGIYPSIPGPFSRCEEGNEAHMNQFLAVFHERRRSLGCDLLGVAHG